MRTYNIKKTAFALIFVALMIFYAFAVFLPHDHPGLVHECPICSLAEQNQSIVFDPAPCFTLLSGLLFVILIASRCVLSNRDRTPVGLKDKLSD